MGSTQDVSWNKPFGNSFGSNLVGGEAGANKMFDNVSMQKPIGETSDLALALGGKGKRNPVAEAKNALPQIPQGYQGSSGGGMAQGGMTGPWSEGNRNSGGEDAFRADYLSSLKPNTAFTFNAQNPNTFGGVAGGAKGNTPVGGA